MRQLIANLLLVIMCLTGILMPVHAYAHNLSDSEIQLMYEHEHDEQDTNSHACDHCCHSTSHCLGLIRFVTALDAISANRRSEPLQFQYSSLNHTPPYPPPIA